MCGRGLVAAPPHQLMEEAIQHINNWNDGISSYWLNISLVCILLGLSRAHKISGYPLHTCIKGLVCFPLDNGRYCPFLQRNGFSDGKVAPGEKLKDLGRSLVCPSLQHLPSTSYNGGLDSSPLIIPMGIMSLDIAENPESQMSI